MARQRRDEAGDFEKLVPFLRTSRGFDFSTYKPATLQRRVQKRMQTVGAEGYADYIDYLEVHQDEFRNLFNTILINVTSFFRDPEAWKYLASDVVPRIVNGKGEDSQIRVWVAGCASGEEAYSVAMVLAEQMGPPRFKDQVRIYATDLDDDALNSSRNASYSEREVESVPPELLAKYFEKSNHRYIFDRDLRRCVIFGRHDLIQDAPISRVDLLTCRNTLMYFNAEIQERILERFHFALREGGFLFLGNAEMLVAYTNIFAPVDLKNRVFTKVSRGRVRDRTFPFGPVRHDAPHLELNRNDKLRDSAFEASPIAQIVVDAAGTLSCVNEKARTMFNVKMHDIGKPFQDVDVSYRPVELRSGMDQAMLQRRLVQHRDVPWASPAGDSIVLDILIIPLLPDSSGVLGTCITFEDVTLSKRLEGELVNFNQELETAYEEVQSTNEELQTTNEELQSMVEELETTNEELQSTNEELVTMNDELRSANEELETLNGALRERSGALNKTNGILESILAGLRDGVIVVDDELRILAWNHASEDLWGLRADEAVTKHLLNLNIGLPVEGLRAPIRSCLSKGETQEVELNAIDRRGRSSRCRITCSPLRGETGEQHGVILLGFCTPTPR